MEDAARISQWAASATTTEQMGLRSQQPGMVMLRPCAGLKADHQGVPVPPYPDHQACNATGASGGSSSSRQAVATAAQSRHNQQLLYGVSMVASKGDVVVASGSAASGNSSSGGGGGSSGPACAKHAAVLHASASASGAQVAPFAVDGGVASAAATPPANSSRFSPSDTSAPATSSSLSTVALGSYGDRFIPSRSASNWCALRLWDGADLPVLAGECCTAAGAATASVRVGGGGGGSAVGLLLGVADGDSAVSAVDAAATAGLARPLASGSGSGTTAATAAATAGAATAAAAVAAAGRRATENRDDSVAAAAYALLLKSELLGAGAAAAMRSSPAAAVAAAAAAPVGGGGGGSAATARGAGSARGRAMVEAAGGGGGDGRVGLVGRDEGGAVALAPPANNMLRFRVSSSGGSSCGGVDDDAFGDPAFGGGMPLALSSSPCSSSCSTSSGSGSGSGRRRSSRPHGWLGACDTAMSLSPIGRDAFLANSSSSSTIGGAEALLGAASALSSSVSLGGGHRRKQRRIARSPFKVLDAPALADDFYLNLVDWSSQNVLAVGLGSCCYLWHASSSKVTKLCDVGASGDAVCSVSWTQRGTHLAVGTANGDVQVWDAVACRKVRSMAGHASSSANSSSSSSGTGARVGCLAWSSGGMLATGSRDRSVVLRDALRSPHDFTARLTSHKSEVCGLKWSPDDRELASGGNDNQLLVWSAASCTSAPGTSLPSSSSSSACQPRLRLLEHTAAVKAIAWSPHQRGLLASGGGTADRCIRFWSTTGGPTSASSLVSPPLSAGSRSGGSCSSLSFVDTGSQVCNIAWSPNANELVTTHGYSQNAIVAWRYPSMAKLATLTGHTMRVLFLALSPDGQTVVTGAGDETLRFWNIFPPPKASAVMQRESILSSPTWSSIR